MKSKKNTNLNNINHNNTIQWVLNDDKSNIWIGNIIKECNEINQEYKPEFAGGYNADGNIAGVNIYGG